MLPQCKDSEALEEDQEVTVEATAEVAKEVAVKGVERAVATVEVVGRVLVVVAREGAVKEEAMEAEAKAEGQSISP